MNAQQRAEHAARILDDPLVKEALDLIEREIVEQWEACPVRDLEGRELLWRFMKTASKFRGILKGAIESGKLDAFRAQQTLKEKALNLVRK